MVVFLTYNNKFQVLKGFERIDGIRGTYYAVDATMGVGISIDVPIEGMTPQLDSAILMVSQHITNLSVLEGVHQISLHEIESILTSASTPVCDIEVKIKQGNSFNFKEGVHDVRVYYGYTYEEGRECLFALDSNCKVIKQKTPYSSIYSVSILGERNKVLSLQLKGKPYPHSELRQRGVDERNLHLYIKQMISQEMNSSRFINMQALLERIATELGYSEWNIMYQE